MLSVRCLVQTQDLSGGNVMLTSCSINPHGFQAKVGDFGLSRTGSATARIAGNLYGTITHMAPEVMVQAQLGPVSIPLLVLALLLCHQVCKRAVPCQIITPTACTDA